ncbi:MAG: type IV toxin-antitoxin system AbiEi family antitoxin [Bacteroidales bacterium]
MTIREWIRDREIHGISTFSVEIIINAFCDDSEQIIRNELYRLSTQGVIKSVYNGFYVIMPVQYAAKGIVPPVYYIDNLMKYLAKPYYISLLNAAELLGAAHQRSQCFNVTTILPKASVSNNKKNILKWLYRAEIPEKYILTKNSETGVIRYSNAELTAIDIIQYSQYIGGLSRATTILSELIEIINFNDKIEDILTFSTLSTLQRLGYILDLILEDYENAEIIYKGLLESQRRLNYIPLNSQIGSKNSAKNKKWKIYINTTIEPDDIG